MCYHADFGRSVLKGAGINTGEPQNWGALEFRCQQRPRLRMASRGKIALRIRLHILVAKAY